MTEYDFCEGDTGSKLRITCKDTPAGAAINLTGSSVKLKWRKPDNTLANVAMTLVDAVNGVVEYQFLTTELKPPNLVLRIEITDSGGKIVSNVNAVNKTVRAAP